MKIKVNFKSLVLLALFSALSNFAIAQKTISGLITDADNKEPLVGAAIVVTGTTKGTLTDVDGKYTLEAIPADATSLTISFTGYANQTVAIGSSGTIDVALKGGSFLEEVVVVGYGTLKSKEVTSSITSVKAEDFNRGNVNSPAQLLQGKVAGLSISRPGGDPNGTFNIRLRGLSTVGANVQPLVIIDGVPGASLNSVDPNDIASMDVLKDGSAAAIYGTRASSGVILITTKKGQAGKTSVEYNGQVTSESVDRTVPVMNATEYVAAGGSKIGPDQTDWFKEITRNSLSHNHNLSMSGGVNKTSYRVALNYRDIQGVLKKSGFQQFNGRINLSQKALNDKLTITTDISASNRDVQFALNEAFAFATVYNPTAPVLDAANTKYGGYYQSESFNYLNPVAILEQSTREGTQKRITGSVRGDYEIVKGLTFGMLYSQNRESDLNGDYYTKTAYFRGIGRNGLASKFTEDRTSNQFNTTLTYAKDLGKIGLNLLGGYEYQDFNTENYKVEAGDFLTDAFGYNNIQVAQDFKNANANIESNRFSSKLVAFFGRVNVNYDDTYFLTASLRREGSSTFGVNNKWGLFPGVSAGVALNKLFNIAGVDNLKLRAGYGVTGALPRDPYLSLLRLRIPPSTFFYNNGKYVNIVEPAANANPNLKWETKAETNVGLDFALFNFKLTGTLEYYSRVTTDLLYNFKVSTTKYQADNITANVGDLRNSGIEFALNFNAVKNAGFSWTTGFNLATFDTKLVSLSSPDFTFGEGGELYTTPVGAPGQSGVFQIRVKEGEPIGQIWGLKETSIDDKGLPVFEDLNKDGKYDQKDEQVLGSGLPKFTLGFVNTFKIGNFDVNFLIRGAFGHNLVNQFRTFYENSEPGSIKAFNRVQTKYWDPKLKNANYSSRYVESADFVKLDNFTVGYNLSMPSGSAFSNLRFFVSGNNIATFTGYTGVDPEVQYGDSEADNNPLAPGIERRNNYLRTRSFSFGVTAGF
jgi:TonB-dependent starch-binding outer membrane protein SusC